MAGDLKSLRAAVFPISNKDVPQFLLLGGLKFLVVFVLTLTRDLKDTLIVTSCGAEAITFLKFYGVLPASALFFMAYSKLSNLLSKSSLWIATATPFFIFYVLFALAVPALDLDNMRPTEVAGLQYAQCVVQRWPFALFYVMSELYSSVSIGILFWQFANDVVPVDKSTSYYPLFAQVSSLAPIVTGVYVERYAANGQVTMSTSVRRVVGAVTACGILMIGLHQFYLRHYQTPATAQEKSKTGKREKPKLSMLQSVRFLASSSYLGYLSVLVLSYGLTIQFTDIIWKSMVKKAYPDPIEYQRYTAQFSRMVGMTTFFVIFIGSNIVKHLGWKFGALATPMMMFVLALPFFAVLLLEDMNDLNHTSLMAVVTLGACQSMLSKAAKNALFDPTTQMAYIPLDAESKVKGKAAIDVMGSRFGKSGGALIQQGLVLVFGSIITAAPAVAALFFAVIAAWVYSAFQLAEQFEAKLKAKEKDKES